MTPPPADLGPHYDSVPSLPPAEAERWVKLAHRGLWASWVLAGLWVFVYATLFVFAAEGDVCTEADPCRYGWPDLPFFTAGVAAVLLAPIAVVRFPVIGLISGLLAAVIVPTNPDLTSYPSWVLVLMGTGIVGTCSVSIVRILARQEQRAIVGRHSVTVPGLDLRDQDLPASGWVLVVSGCALLAVALTTYTAYRDHQWDQHANRAQEIVGPVTEHGSDGYLITVNVGDDTVTIDTIDASMYPIGAEVTVLRDGDWSALAADPYDPTMVALVLGPLLLVGGLAAHGPLRVHLSRRRLSTAHPALRVDVLPDRLAPGRRVLISANDEVGSLARLPVAMRPAHRRSDGDDWDDGDHWGEEDGSAARAPMCQRDPAVLHGHLLVGLAPTLVVFPEDAEPQPLQTAGPLAVPTEWPWRPSFMDHLAHGGGRLPEAATATESWMPDTLTTFPGELPHAISLRQPVAFRTPGWLTLLVASGLVGLVGLVAWLVTDSSLFQLAWLTLSELFLVGGAFRVATWRAQVDADGIVARVGLTKLRVSWDEIRALPTEAPGTLLTRDREVAMLLPLPAPSARVLTKGESERLMQIIEAIHRDPSLRPTTVIADPPPLIPELIVGLAGIPVAVNLAAWFLAR